MPNEFEIIERYFHHAAKDARMIEGIGDDCAILRFADNVDLAFSTDSLVAGVHFFEDAAPFDIGYKSLAVNLSDCAAMGATPAFALLALTLPKADEAWLRDFSSGFFELARAFDVKLAGGNLSHGPLNVTVQIIGTLPKNQALRRGDAKVGDDIYVTGTLGDAAYALQVKLGKAPPLAAPLQNMIDTRLQRPTARVAAGKALLGIAHSAIDLSDGLMQDLGHILKASNCGAVIDANLLPLSHALQTIDVNIAKKLALSGGEDYELCFTAAKSEALAVEQLSQQLQLPVHRIGEIVPGNELRVLNHTVVKEGFQHF